MSTDWGARSGTGVVGATYARFGRSAPAFTLKPLFGESATELLTSKRVLPSGAQESRFKQEFGGLDRALADLLA